jgi:hypothetical protein
VREFIVDGSTQLCQTCGELMYRTEVAEYRSTGERFEGKNTPKGWKWIKKGSEKKKVTATKEKKAKEKKATTTKSRASG